MTYVAIPLNYIMIKRHVRYAFMLHLATTIAYFPVLDSC